MAPRGQATSPFWPCGRAPAPPYCGKGRGEREAGPHPKGPALSHSAEAHQGSPVTGVSGLAEQRVAPLEAGGDRLDLVRAADQRTDLLLLRREAGRQVGPPGEVKQALRRPDSVRAAP